ncbi:MAG: translational GTPase TypA [Anaerolineales bacterium]|nr:translational GTPase TypA [Anaerolineales bacterium]
MQIERTDLRNIAISAHVDHGKTTLVDGLLRQARTFRENQQVVERVMDSNDLERERGITIFAKNASFTYRGIKVNIVDTPGHADFGGEVERVMNMVDGVLLLVDAAEGPMPQTRFVLRKALEMRHQVIVVINKVDRKDAEPDVTLNKTFDLFIELGASDEQADFPVIYCNAITQQAGPTPALSPDYQPLFEAILNHIPVPKVDPEAPTQMLVTTLNYDDYKGLMAVGRIFNGRLRRGQVVARIDHEGRVNNYRLTYLFAFQGLARVEVEEASAGDLVAVAGMDEAHIGDTVADPETPLALPGIRVEPPTVRMTFGVNTSPFGGREGKYVTSRHIRDRLARELEHNVSLRVEDTDQADKFLVSGRGELHLAILIETMRREGYELEVSRPEVINMKGEAGEVLEPFEEVHIEVAESHMGTVIEMLGRRRGQMTNMHQGGDGSVYMTYIVPTRGLLGFRYQFLTATQGTGQMHSLFHDYLPYAGGIEQKELGSVVAIEPGTSTAYAIRNAEDRAMLFIEPGVEVYEGMVVGQHVRPEDLLFNICTKKQLTNVRAARAEVLEALTPPRRMSLDECIEYLGEDELLEVTPQSLRIRKRILHTEQRAKEQKRAEKALEEA